MGGMEESFIDFFCQSANKLGFCDIGFAKVTKASHQSQTIFTKWLMGKKHATMYYLEKNAEYRKDVRKLFPFAKSVIGVLLPYPTKSINKYISAYVTKPDYHKYIKSNLTYLMDMAKERLNKMLEYSIVVDSSITSEREWAVRCGLGWIGKQGMLINPKYGCCVFIGLVFINIDLPENKILEDNCGDCEICTKNCPTGAIQSDRTINAQKCLSFLTIEYRGSFQNDTSLHNSLYGCDRCSLCCPWNKCRTISSSDYLNQKWIENININEITPERCITMTKKEFDELFSETAVNRINLGILQRNAKKILEEQAYAAN